MGVLLSLIIIDLLDTTNIATTALAGVVWRWLLLLMMMLMSLRYPDISSDRPIVVGSSSSSRWVNGGIAPTPLVPSLVLLEGRLLVVLVEGCWWGRIATTTIPLHGGHWKG